MKAYRLSSGDATRSISFLRTYAEFAGAATSRRRSELLLDAARREAELSNRVKGEFVAHMSHDLRTPLNAIIGFSDVLSSTSLVLDNPERAREYAADIHHAGQHLLKIINAILDLAKLESGQCELEIGACDLRDVLYSTELMAGPQALKKRQSLSVSLPESFPCFRADTLKMKQVMINLVSNAIKFTPEGGRIEIMIDAPPDGDLSIQVADSGIGMNPDELSIALSKFGRVRNALTRQEEGSGLGLTIVKNLCALQGLQFLMRSQTGRGTVASVIVPRHLVLSSPPVQEQVAG